MYFEVSIRKTTVGNIGATHEQSKDVLIVRVAGSANKSRDGV